jgi:hypothetical protein
MPESRSRVKDFCKYFITNVRYKSLPNLILRTKKYSSGFRNYPEEERNVTAKRGQERDV